MRLPPSSTSDAVLCVKGVEKRNDQLFEERVSTRHRHEFAEFIFGSMRPERDGLQRQHGNAIASRANCISKFKYGNVKDGDARKTIAGGGKGFAKPFDCEPGHG
jgi:hypothetical protein